MGKLESDLATSTCRICVRVSHSLCSWPSFCKLVSAELPPNGGTLHHAESAKLSNCQNIFDFCKLANNQISNSFNGSHCILVCLWMMRQRGVWPEPLLLGDADPPETSSLPWHRSLFVVLCFLATKFRGSRVHWSVTLRCDRKHVFFHHPCNPMLPHTTFAFGHFSSLCSSYLAPMCHFSILLLLSSFHGQHHLIIPSSLSIAILWTIGTLVMAQPAATMVISNDSWFGNISNAVDDNFYIFNTLCGFDIDL